MRNDDWRLLDLKLSSYAAATPMVSTLLTLKAEEKIPNTLGLITFERPSACLFYYNDPEKELDLEFCRENGIEIGRRDTGSSPYWADRGTLIVYLWFDRKQVPGFPDTIADGYRFLIGATANALSERLGIPAAYRPLNDLEVRGKKIAGHTLTFLGSAGRWGCGPQVLRPRMDLMSRALKVPPEKFSDKQAKTVETRVTNFEELLGRTPLWLEIKEIYVSALEKAIRVRFQPGGFFPDEDRLVREQTARIFSEDWLMAMTEKRKFGDALNAGWARGEFAAKVPQGPLIRAVVLTERNIIRNVSLTGSIHCIPVPLVEEMEAGIRNLEGTEEAVSGVIRKLFLRPGAQVAGCAPEDFIRVILTAVQNAKTPLKGCP